MLAISTLLPPGSKGSIFRGRKHWGFAAVFVGQPSGQETNLWEPVRGFEQSVRSAHNLIENDGEHEQHVDTKRPQDQHFASFELPFRVPVAFGLGKLVAFQYRDG
jgi:hypothetical protein